MFTSARSTTRLFFGQFGLQMDQSSGFGLQRFGTVVLDYTCLGQLRLHMFRSVGLDYKTFRPVVLERDRVFWYFPSKHPIPRQGSRPMCELMADYLMICRYVWPPLPFRQISSRPAPGRANHNCLSNMGAGSIR